MSFLSRIASHLINEVLVNGLANSRTFQRFAIWSNNAAADAVRKGGEHLGQASEFASAFKEQMKKEIANSSAAAKSPPKR